MKKIIVIATLAVVLLLTYGCSHIKTPMPTVMPANTDSLPADNTNESSEDPVSTAADPTESDNGLIITPVAEETPTLTATITETPADTATADPSSKPTQEASPTPTSTVTPTSTPTPAQTSTPTSTPVPTDTPIPEHDHVFTDWEITWEYAPEDPDNPDGTEMATAKTLSRVCTICHVEESMACPFHIVFRQGNVDDYAVLDGIYDSIESSTFYANGTVTIPRITYYQSRRDRDVDYYDIVSCPSFVSTIILPYGETIQWNG